jgi:hypothetical protein
MAYATNEDLVKLHPTILDHGIVDWTDEIQLAEDDINLIIKTKWFVQEFGSLRTRGMVIAPIFNPALLVPEQWTKATAYRALYAYILPKLSTFRPEGDTFSTAADFFDQRYDEEMDLQLSAGVMYDLNADGTIKESEKFPSLQNRLYR